MKVFLLGFAFCILHVSLARDGAGAAQVRNVQMRPLHKPETQNNPIIIPVPVYTPVQQQYQPLQQVPVQQYPYPPVQQYPVNYPLYPMHGHHHYSYPYPQNFHGIPC